MAQWLKCTFLIKQVTGEQIDLTNFTQPGQNQRVAGWSESWYLPATDPAPSRKCLALARARAQLLTRRAQIYGVRTSLVNPRGKFKADPLFVMGNSQLTQDMPTVSVLATLGAHDTNNVRNIYFRGWPDADIVNGELVNTASAQARADLFATILSDNGFSFRGRDFNQTLVGIDNITAGGIITTTGIIPVEIQDGSRIQVIRTNVAGQLRRVQEGAFVTVKTRTDDTNLLLNRWPLGMECLGGDLRIAETVYPRASKFIFTVQRATTRKVGRPSDLYVGRRSVRR